MDIDIIKSEFDRICDEQEKIDCTGFGKVLQCLNKEVLQGIKHPVLFPFTDNVEAITKALEMTGHKKDEAFCARFMKYCRLFVEGKQIQSQGLDIIANAIPKCGKQSGGFYFVPISIYTPADNNELQQAISDILEQDAKEGKGLYANITQIPKEDEFLDSLLCVEAFNCKHSFTKWLDELKRYNVAGKQGAFLNEKLTRFLFELVNKCANVIKDNTDSPNKTKNSLNDIISSLDELSVWGLFFQILILQGIFTMLESIDINEEQNGFDEAQSLYDWIAEILYKKIIRFSRGYYGDNDLATLQPFCEYLCTTAAGEAVQQRVKSEYYPELQEISKNPILPKELNNDEAINLLKRLVKAGFCFEVFSWNPEKTEYQAAACAHHISFILWGKNRWKPFESLWGKSNMAQTYNRIPTDANETSVRSVDDLFPENKPQKKH